ncbi:adenylate/guanylate cyclase domain-containing protein [Hyalangium sp.]|uniref:adenylate/guanylate cyclase domain-containing protein n=1 Tax=Hyalangium sp. TaxID=2028555 RepID=UPI002D2C2C36|nr:adenylate/guanylate cyclase domain-containing protein [Hyalangium sp.]HYI01955.1 adenylate/guanylate cyclase domain-containing protein [Hyalangium sp.]
MAIQYSRTQERLLPAPPELVWGLVADSNRWDRLVGLNPTQYRYTTLDAEGQQVRARLGFGIQSWGVSEWLERGEWVEGQHIQGMRQYVSGPLRLGGFRAELSPVGAGARVSVTAYVEADKPLDAQLESRVLQAFDQALKLYFDALARLFTRARMKGELEVGPEPAVIQARQLLGRMEPDGSAFGLRGLVQDKELELRAQRFASAPIVPELRERIIRFAREGFDDELRQIRPFALARIWGFERREVLRGFLHAVRAGLYELQWQLECPMCREGVQELPGLEQVKREGYCVDCDRAFRLDFGANVEAIFTASPAVRFVASGSYCAASPWFRPHVMANFIVPPHGQREVSLELPDGAYTVRTTMRRYRTGLPASPGARLQVTLESGTLGVSIGEAVAGEPGVSLVLSNDTPYEEEFSLERADWAPEAALGRDVLAVPDFHDLFPTEAPATGVELSIGSMVVLFSDLTGSTSLYEQLGDARAFALIEQHFRTVEQAVARHGGAVLKTMGDAVMATFPRAGVAFSAALEMVRETEQLHSHHGLRLKVGLHEGPCLAVRANQRLDLFGTTVNLAARLQGAAKGGQVVLLERLFQHPEIAEHVAREHLESSRFEAELRGVSERQSCVAVVTREKG